MLLLNVNSESGGGSGPGTTEVLVALCVNLASCERAAHQMAAEGRLRDLLARAFRHRNTMLMNLVRNLSHHAQNKTLFVVSILHFLFSFHFYHLLPPRPGLGMVALKCFSIF
jgi:hypothetical protein